MWVCECAGMEWDDSTQASCCVCVSSWGGGEGEWAHLGNVLEPTGRGRVGDPLVFAVEALADTQHGAWRVHRDALRRFRFVYTMRSGGHFGTDWSAMARCN